MSRRATRAAVLIAVASTACVDTSDHAFVVAPAPPNLARSTVTDPTATYRFPLADAALSVKSDHAFADGTYSVYAHLSGRSVQESDSVSAGQQIGSVGYTGNAAALKAKGLPPHLHFALIQATKSGLAGSGGPLRRMRNLDDSWESLGAEFTGPVNPEQYVPSSCWSGG